MKVTPSNGWSHATALRRHDLGEAGREPSARSTAGGTPALRWAGAAMVVLGLLLAGAGCNSSGEDLNVMIPKMIDKWKGPSNIDAAADLFNATNPDARRIAVAHISMKKWGHEAPYMKAYHVLATSDPNPMVRGQALRALGTSHQPAVAEDLLTGLANPDVNVRRDATAAMCDVGN
ncbi:MAG: HEAT repeat domain-containing protein, partial [Phycisphaerae bacterium]